MVCLASSTRPWSSATACSLARPSVFDFLMACSIWNMALSKPVRLLRVGQSRSFALHVYGPALLLNTFLSSNVEVGYNALLSHLLATFAHIGTYFSITFDLALSAKQTRCLFARMRLARRHIRCFGTQSLTSFLRLFTFRPNCR